MLDVSLTSRIQNGGHFNTTGRHTYSSRVELVIESINQWAQLVFDLILSLLPRLASLQTQEEEP